MANACIWMSFVDPHRPEGQRFLGVIITWVEDQGSDKENLRAAMEKAWELKINPGGEIGSCQLPHERALKVSPHHLDKLLSREELEEAGY